MLTTHLISDVVSRALSEDAPWGDLTVELTIPEDATIDTRLVAREAGVSSIAGRCSRPKVSGVSKGRAWLCF